METLTLAATPSTPTVDLDAARGVLRLSGESYPENSFDFYRPIKGWLARFIASETGPITVELRLAYLNTGSTKCILDILDMLEDAHRARREVAVRWFYERGNERALEAAEELSEEVTLPFHIVAVDVSR